MTSPRERAAEGLQVGDQFTVMRCFSEDDIRQFAQISRDYNPVHCDTPYAALRGFKRPIAHGLLTASLVTEVGGQMGWLATGMSFEFKRPVYAGDLITCHWLIAGIDEQGHAKAEVRIVNAEGITVLEATTTGVLPSAEQRERLGQMLAEGDPTNGAARPEG
ncbi:MULTISPECIES: MaoC family dehydratase [unclassified Pseudomonas]|jgi:acyl dehydratase|uniref:MaoC family dehydratase n=1 Tax=unclassified Pseudomonas TaxID=196821 RepID=UPI0002885BF3|nr:MULTISPECIES: MaoC family dehydratase [unclassified Pseudomonas]MDF3197445.1 MaoC family dehydratase [Pseudomonas sp. 1912-s]QJI36678.1 MaoC family dehydratase [Pseudomonas sp. ADAK13]